MVKSIVLTVSDEEHREIRECVERGEARSMADFVRVSTIRNLERIHNRN